MSNADKPIWLLDVDGVINIDRSSWYESPHWGIAYYRGTPYKIKWCPSLVKRIKAVIDADSATAMWCTTWCEAADQIERLLGLPPLPRVFKDLPRDFDVSNSRKREIAEDIVKSGVRLIWTDDLAVSHDFAAGNERVLAIQPSSNRGLTPEHMNQIEAFINA